MAETMNRSTTGASFMVDTAPLIRFYDRANTATHEEAAPLILGIMLNPDWTEWPLFHLDREDGEGYLVIGPLSFLWMRSRPFDQSEQDDSRG